MLARRRFFLCNSADGYGGKNVSADQADAGASTLANRSRTIGATRGSLLVQSFDLLNQRVDLVRCETAFVLGHVTFAVSNDVAQLVGGGGRDFVRDEGRPAEVAPFRIFSVTLRAVIYEDMIRGQGRVRRLGLAQSCS
jgi:hypothetical protein